MKNRAVGISLIVFYLLVLMSSINAKAAPITRLRRPPQQKIIKAKGYQHYAFAIIWYDIRGNGTCDVAEFYEKKDGYFILRVISCKKADAIDEYVLEPKI